MDNLGKWFDTSTMSLFGTAIDKNRITVTIAKIRTKNTAVKEQGSELSTGEITVKKVFNLIQGVQMAEPDFQRGLLSASSPLLM